ncbi:thioesterase [Clostridium estertheticum]|uniref:Thioesterase n=1 Tax=Clostridium estertheticum TaxID=238834 RepID=A0A5N7IUS7_9CLOT|nr:thioesterase domain-containing protein [Clostridium estertheticum]MPQ34068.1 thioesterase [Clostridium estertheticum]MPQ64869.1 thioesterase [Clostridium estertheticum]
MRIRSNNGKLLNLSSSWFCIPKPNPNAKIRLFCFPYAGGMPEIYYSWLNELSNQIELVVIKYPGHVPGSSETLYTNLTTLSKELAQILSRNTDKKYAFFGHSMGALISFELATQLNIIGAKAPEYLFLAAKNPPDIPVEQPPIYEMTMEEIIQLARSYNALPEEVLGNHELLKLIIPILKADFEMIEKWSINEDFKPLNTPMCVFSGINDSLGLPKNMAEWQKYTKSEFKMIKVPEQHYFILNKLVRKNIIKIIENIILK